MNDPRPLAPADIAPAMDLSIVAGWNQTPADWARVLAFEPEGCFGIELDGRLVATTTAVCYGARLAWIGMVLTHPDYRGRGLARRLMTHTLDWLDRRQVEWIKLDATDMGRPLYASLEFVDESIVQRWMREPEEMMREPEEMTREPGEMTREPGEVPAPPAVAPGAGFDPAADLAVFGVDRLRLLETLREESASCDAGYAMGRDGRLAAYFGPCVSASAAAASGLLAWFLARWPARRVCWDLLADNTEAEALARRFGFQPQRRLTRMVRRGSTDAAPIVCRNAKMYAIAGFEYG